MRLDRLTVKVQQAMIDAQAAAAEAGHRAVGPLHMLAALLRQEGGLAGTLLEKVGVPADRVQSIVDSELQRLPSQSAQAAQTADPVTSAEDGRIYEREIIMQRMVQPVRGGIRQKITVEGLNENIRLRKEAREWAKDQMSGFCSI